MRSRHDSSTTLVVVATELAAIASTLLLSLALRICLPASLSPLLPLLPLLALPLVMLLLPPFVRTAVRQSSRKPVDSETLREVVHSSLPPKLRQQPEPTAPPKHPSLMQQLHVIDWYQFEKLIALTIRKRGHNVSRSGGAHPDGGIDLLIQDDGNLKAVQCKHWKTWRVGIKDVREFLGALTAAGIPKGVFVTLGEFTEPARELAARHNIQLLDGVGLLETLHSLNAAYDPDFQTLLKSTRKFCPKCESPMVLRTMTKASSINNIYNLAKTVLFWRRDFAAGLAQEDADPLASSQ